MKDTTPRNEEGEAPTRSSNETIDRLEEKKRKDRGQANKERIEDQEREVGSER